MRKIFLFVLYSLFIESIFATQDTDYDAKFGLIPTSIVDSGSTILVRGDMKAEYIQNKNRLKPSSIVITIKDKKHKISIPVSKESLKCMKTNKIKNNTNFNEDELFSLCFYGFSSFRQFSPSGYYLSYKITGWESEKDIMIDTRTGKVVLLTDWNNFIGWTKDHKRFVYGGSAGMGTNRGLYITIKGQFPKVKQILDEDVLGGYIDDKNIYIKTLDYLNDKENFTYKVIDLKNLKVIFSKKIT